MSSKKNAPAAKLGRGGSQAAAQNRRKYALKRKIPLNLLLSLTAPLTVCFFGPFETYCGNLSEFRFSLGDFLPVCILVGLLIAAALFAVLHLLDGKAYEIACAVTVWLSLMLFAQRYYLNMGINSLAGDGVGEAGVKTWMVVLNAVIWLAVGALVVAALVLLKKKNIAPFFVSCAALMILMLAMETVGFASLSFTTDAYVPVTERVEENADGEAEPAGPAVLTYKNLNHVAKQNNVIFFLIDRFDIRYYDSLQKSEPEFFEKLDGFTFYTDYTSLYCRTYPAVASILTGKENDFTESRLNFFKEIYTDGGPLRELHNAGYEVNVYTEKYYAYDDAAYMAEYTSNLSGTDGYTIDSELALAKDMLRLSLSSYLPISLKGIVGYMSTPDFNAHAVYDSTQPVFDADMKNVYDYITAEDFTTTSADGQFSFIHLYGCHTPIKYNLDWDEANDKEKNDTTMALKQSLTIIYEYIEEMKRLGVYEDATIIITGDHPAALSDSKLIGEASKSDNGTRVTAMLFKESGKSGDAPKVSTAQISQDELWNTIYASEGLTALKTGDSFFDIPEGEDRVRRYFFERSVKVGDERADEIVEYKITGTARDRENWEIEEVTVVGKIYK